MTDYRGFPLEHFIKASDLAIHVFDQSGTTLGVDCQATARLFPKSSHFESPSSNTYSIQCSILTTTTITTTSSSDPNSNTGYNSSHYTATTGQGRTRTSHIQRLHHQFTRINHSVQYIALSRSRQLFHRGLVIRGFLDLGEARRGEAI